MLKALRGFIQGYNAQTVTNERQVVIAAEVMTAAPDFGHRRSRVGRTDSGNGGIAPVVR